MDPVVERILNQVDRQPAGAAYIQAARELNSHRGGLQPIRLALLATFTVDPLVPYLQVEVARQGFQADIYVGPFNAVKQELLDSTSGCIGHRPDVVFVAQQLRDVCPALTDDYLALNPDQVEQQTEQMLSELLATLRTFRSHSAAAMVLHNFALPLYPALGIYEAMAESSQTDAIRRLNIRLVEVAKSVPAVYVLDYERLCADVGYRNWFDSKMWYLGRAPLSAQALPVLARAQVVFVQAIVGSPRKCLVLDLDNTLWGGVVGEDGVSGIKLGHAYPGSAFRDFQRAILRLYRRGVILAINSKNNLADVEEVFRSHRDMVLRWEHFAATRINWRDKPTNMREIAEELNIGLESLVFFDDSPVERALMREMLPEALTLEVPADPLKFCHVLLESHAFDRLSLTKEDRRRGEMYREQVARRQLEQSAASLDDFYHSLEMVVDVRPVDDFAFPRVVDLIHKTNQFNLTTRRHPASSLSEMVAHPDVGAFSVRVADRFGDNGIVGVAIIRVRGTIGEIDSLLLSCRVIGRTVETAMLSFLADWAKAHGLTALQGEFIPTAKNAPAADFYPQHGFTQVDDKEGRLWRLDLHHVPFAWPSYIRRNSEISEKGQ